MKFTEADVICFDVDYTLVKYSNTDFIYLQFDALAKMMIKNGAPEELLSLIPRDQMLTLAGNCLIADFHTGCLIKLASDNTVIRAYFGLSSVEDLTNFYGPSSVYPLEQAEKYYIPENRWIFITHFSFGGTLVWLAAVELMKQNRFPLTSYSKLGEFIYACASKTYGSVKDSDFYPEIYKNPDLYIKPVSDEFKQGLYRLKDSGKKLAIITNGPDHYANFIMEYAYGANWHSLFDAYVFSAGKPDFFYHENELEMIEHLALDGEAFTKGSSTTLKNKIGGHHYIFVGDHYISDVHGAKQFDWLTVALVEEIYYEKGLKNLASKEQIENSHLQPPDDDVVFNHSVWGSHFIDNGKRNFWWDFILTHADSVIPSIENLFDLFSYE